MRDGLLALFLVGVLALPTRALAAGWTKAPGEFYLKISDRSLIGSRAYAADGEVVDVEDFQDHQLNAYFEYGLVESWTLVAFGSPLGYANARRSTLYAGPLVAGARYGLVQDGPLKLALEGHYGFSPGLGDRELLLRPEAAPDAAAVVYVPALYNHHGELQLQLGYGFGFGFVSAAAGTRLNSRGDMDPAITGFAQVGINPLDGLTVLLQTGAYQPLGEVEIANASGVGQTRYVGIGLGVHYAIDEHIGVLIALDGGVGVESNAAAPSLQAGVDLR